MIQRGSRARLSQQVAVGSGQILAQNLDGHFPAQGRIVRAIDASHSASADLAEHGKPSKLWRHRRLSSRLDHLSRQRRVRHEPWTATSNHHEDAHEMLEPLKESGNQLRADRRPIERLTRRPRPSWFTTL